ncbi:MAG: hypothetical protein K8R85_00690 [Bacteroidetes bacterium]|nr:hypothetical protein [Bacteroidota bacterium]
MTKKLNNNFADTRTKSLVRFRLFIIHNQLGIQAGHRRKFGYNGYITHSDKGYSKLLKILDARKGMIVKALMYDFTKSRTKPITEWDFSKKKKSVK